LAETAKKDTAEMRYLLGGLSEEEKTRMEEAFFADDSKFEAVELAEDELIDAYVRKELTAEQLQQFHKKLRTSPRLVERVHFAGALSERTSDPYAGKHEVSIQPAFPFSQPAAEASLGWWELLFGQQPILRVAFTACVVLLLIGGVVLFASWLRLRGESNRIVAERADIRRQKEELDKQLSEQQARTAQLSADLQRERAQRAEDLKLIEKLERTNQLKETQPQQPLLSTVATVFLMPGLSRSGGGQGELVIRPGTTTARMQLALEKNDYKTYNAVITIADGTVVTRKNGLKAHKGGSGPHLLLFVPARNLSADNYLVHVDGVTATGQVEDVNDYAFRVPKE
jgi:hypothetical protein